MFVEVLLPVPIQGSFTYSVPNDLQSQIHIGQRVIVQFGTRRKYTGIVCSITPVAPVGYEVKPILMIVDEKPVVRHPQLKFWNWIADYYLCTPGEVYKAAVPAGLKIESETYISPVKHWEEDPDNRLTDRELAVMSHILESGENKLMLEKIVKATGITNIWPVVDSLMQRGAVMIAENLVDRYHSRKETYVKLTAEKGDSEALHRAFDAVKKGSRQETALLALLELSGFMRQNLTAPIEVTRSLLMDRSGATTTVIAAMAKKGIVEVYTRKIGRFDCADEGSWQMPELTDNQNRALKAIHDSWHEKGVCLLRGVTSSGKTEIYIHLLKTVMDQNRQALYLVPEIALTTQLTSRLQRVFGNKVVVYHSKFSDNERVEIWKRLLDTNEPCVVIGARSSVFLPYSSLGLVIVDEEHESSFKQQDPAPRYNARDAAIMLASMHGAKTLLGSATPTVETYYKAKTGRFGLVELTERYGGVSLPEVKIIDMTDARKKYQITGIFSMTARRLINESVETGHQAIIFLNRRGYAPVARCKQCGYVPKCEYCDVSLTYHRRIDRLMCHYCGRPYPVPEICPACKEPGIEVLGYGTERIEEEIEQYFPGVEMSRMDLDTTRNKDGYDNLIRNFSEGKSRILVGTQMVTKGLDFGNVDVVCVANADAIVNFPDFRSAERAFNMLEQVSGRAGRKDGNGVVAIQTYSPAHPVFPFVKAHDYTGFYEYELQQRQTYLYPPFARVIYIYVKHKEAEQADAIAYDLTRRLAELLGNRVKGPEEPTVGRVQNWFIRRIMLKIETNASLTKVKELLLGVKIKMTNEKRLGGSIVFYDVDPM